MKRILIVEDDLVVCNIYSNRFRCEGFEVEAARDGQAGKEMLLSFKPDLVILDLVLPKVNGVEVLKFIRSHPALKAIPVVIFSNSYLASMVQEAWKAGATKCLSKIDCTPRQLLQVVNETLAAAAAPPAPPASGAPSAPPAPPPRPAPALPETISDDAFQAELRRTFLQGGPQTVAALRGLLVAFSKAGNDAERLGQLQELGRQARLLCGNAGIVGMVNMARLAAALEALLKDLYEKPRNINASTVRTVAQTVDFLSVLFERGVTGQSGELASAKTLVVDDEVISRRAVTHALNRAGLQSVAIEDSKAALQLLAENQFDLVILDIEMPGLDGFALCGKLRALPQHAHTPVVFVTGHSDFESRAKSIISGGNDLIAKPFLFMELAVKALIQLLRGPLGQTLPGQPAPTAARARRSDPAD